MICTLTFEDRPDAGPGQSNVAIRLVCDPPATAGALTTPAGGAVLFCLPGLGNTSAYQAAADALRQVVVAAREADHGQ